MFSFIYGLLRDSKKIEKAELAEKGNLQNMALLHAALNNDPNPAKGGGDITIVNGVALLSEAGPSGSVSENTINNSSDQISVYVVRKGDTLSQIADMFGVSVNTIIWANDISKGARISPGDTLVILPISGIKYEVKGGDTLKSVVKKYGGDLEEVMKYNGIDENTALAVGDTIVIPDGEVPQPRITTQSPIRSSGGTVYVGYYINPVAGSIKSQGLHGYNGIDLSAPAGMPIVASAGGQVVISKDYGWNGGYGNYVVIKHNNGTQTLYAHNSTNIVFAGQWVVQGQVIGYVGSTGRSTGPHLHFEVRGAANPF
ncbi:peptidoglycan DD-metalloendopeptidase family protein [Patescibacteria group bacterium]|nr:peptidoglycan DD-metalloendopeptidase family protein [Patescibacteria group bacterium]MBU4057532.1 peptidoglycan DD-metalloendopeptidase family protein [Patescibacteria group bacterium]MBU4115571.1 peptidoglycan DD-metalloendopeptidase family protein [Patescibacteria group bacterium]